MIISKFQGEKLSDKDLRSIYGQTGTVRANDQKL
jgi:hypothetical protein